jgi:hypothetical protein
MSPELQHFNRPTLEAPENANAFMLQSSAGSLNEINLEEFKTIDRVNETKGSSSLTNTGLYTGVDKDKKIMLKSINIEAVEPIVERLTSLLCLFQKIRCWHRHNQSQHFKFIWCVSNRLSLGVGPDKEPGFRIALRPLCLLSTSKFTSPQKWSHGEESRCQTEPRQFFQTYLKYLYSSDRLRRLRLQMMHTAL